MPASVYMDPQSGWPRFIDEYDSKEDWLGLIEGRKPVSIVAMWGLTLDDVAAHAARIRARGHELDMRFVPTQKDAGVLFLPENVTAAAVIALTHGSDSKFKKSGPPQAIMDGWAPYVNGKLFGFKMDDIWAWYFGNALKYFMSDDDAYAVGLDGGPEPTETLVAYRAAHRAMFEIKARDIDALLEAWMVSDAVKRKAAMLLGAGSPKWLAEDQE